jgi:hypothetical protein
MVRRLAASVLGAARRQGCLGDTITVTGSAPARTQNNGRQADEHNRQQGERNTPARVPLLPLAQAMYSSQPAINHDRCALTGE